MAHTTKNVERYPLDVVKTRIQLQHGVVKDGQGYNGVMDCFRKIIRNEGATRLYRGITAPILMEVPKRSVTPSQTIEKKKQRHPKQLIGPSNFHLTILSVPSTNDCSMLLLSHNHSPYLQAQVLVQWKAL